MNDEQYEALRKQYAELVNYISSMAREIGTFRQETNEKIDALTEEFRQHRKETNERLDALEKREAKIEDQMEDFKYHLQVISGDIGEIKGKHWRFDARLRKLEGEAA